MGFEQRFNPIKIVPSSETGGNAERDRLTRELEALKARRETIDKNAEASGMRSREDEYALNTIDESITDIEKEIEKLEE